MEKIKSFCFIYLDETLKKTAIVEGTVHLGLPG